MEPKNFIETLALRTPLLNNLDRNEVISVLRCCLSNSFENGSTIFKEGSKGSQVYIIVSGSVKFKKKGRTINVIRSGDCVGEISAVSDQDCVYSAVDTTLLKAPGLLSKSAF